MFQGMHGSKSALGPEDLTMIKDIYDEWCAARCCSKDSPSAIKAAQELISMFEHGVRSKDDLRIMVGTIGADLLKH
ncbi:hypothetical protein HFO27_01855 [Rhizobium leguminosarum]|nr:hypothetical protein [Rhizobium leguminosarum]